jgi:GNAT superfamily N-acetyltransferase
MKPIVRPPLARARAYLNRAGARLDDAGLPVRRRSLLLFGRPASPVREASAAPPDVTVDTITPACFGALEWSANPSVRDEAAAFGPSGVQVPVGAVARDRLHGFCWLEAGVADIRFFDVEAALPPGTAYLSRVWVDPSKRGSGLGRSLIERATAVAAELGHRDLVSACVPANARMRHLFGELGWAPLGRADYLRLGPLVLFRRKRPGLLTLRAHTLDGAGRALFAAQDLEAR